MKENLTKCLTGIWSFIPYSSLSESIQYGINNFATSIVIRTLSQTKKRRKKIKTIEGKTVFEIFIEENNTSIDTSKIQHPAIIINKKWEIIKEINFEDLLIEIYIELNEIESIRKEHCNALTA